MRKSTYLYFLLLIGLPFITYAQKAPDFTVTDVHGRRFSLYKDYLDKGKAVMLKLFFVACPPCNADAPKIKKIYENDWQSGKGQVEFIELSVKAWDDDEGVLGYTQKHGLTFPSVSPQGNSLVAASPYTRGDYGRFLGTPTYVVIGPKGDVHYRIARDQLTDTLKEALKTPPPVDNCPASFRVKLKPYGKVFQGITAEDFDVRLISDELGADVYEINYKDSLYDYECEYELPLDTSGYYLHSSYHAIAEDGVNTKDLLFVLWHLIGRRPFKDQILLYAADVNENGLINIQDILFIRQIILGKKKAFPKDSAVRVWDATNEIVLDTLVDTLPKTRNVIPLNELVGQKDALLKAVKLGDITGTEEGLVGNGSSNTRSNTPTLLYVNDVYLKKGEKYSIPVYSGADQSLYTFQMGVSVEHNGCTLDGIVTENKALADFTHIAAISDKNSNVLFVTPKIPTDFKKDLPVFYFHITAKKSGQLSDFISLSKSMDAMSTDDNLLEHPVRLLFRDINHRVEGAPVAISYHPQSKQITVRSSMEDIIAVQVVRTDGQLLCDKRNMVTGRKAIKINVNSSGIFYVIVWTGNGRRSIRRFVSF